MPLHTALRLPNGVTVPNRLAVAPMTTTQSHPDGRPSDAERAWLRRLAGDGYGLVITCAAAGGVFTRADAERGLALGADLIAIGRAAIGNDRVPERLARDEALVRPPFSRERLAALAVSPDFIGYMTRPGPVASMNLVG
jgi:2,4-dienoyl-CoA reductase-like NADH-dependent reductase (Old Yellow Enzyme family)